MFKKTIPKHFEPPCSINVDLIPIIEEIFRLAFISYFFEKGIARFECSLKFFYHLSCTLMRYEKCLVNKISTQTWWEVENIHLKRCKKHTSIFLFFKIFCSREFVSLEIVCSIRLIRNLTYTRYNHTSISHLDMKHITSFRNKIPKRTLFWRKSICQEKYCF